MPTSYAKLAHASSATDASTYTFSAQPLGANGDVPKVVFVGARSNTANAGLASRVRIGGIDLTKLVQVVGSATVNTPKSTSSIWIGDVGLTGNQDIVVDFTANGEIGGTAATQLRCAIEVGESDIGLTAFDTATNTNDDPAISTTIDVPNDGLVLATDCCGVNADPTLVVTGLANTTTEIQIGGEMSHFAVANEGSLAVETGRTITFTLTGTGGDDDHTLAVVSLSPAVEEEDGERGHSMFVLPGVA